MKTLVEIGILTCCALLAGCDADRIAKLERENADLKTKVEKQDAAIKYDLRARCSKDARTWFNQNWSRDKDTAFLDFTNHYNTKLNKCFVFVEWHYNSPWVTPGEYLWMKVINLNDVYENSKYAQFSENHYTHTKPQFSTQEEVITCDVAGTKCKTNTEFNDLVRSYMND